MEEDVGWQYKRPRNAARQWTRLKLARALPWRRFKKGSVLTMKVGPSTCRHPDILGQRLCIAASESMCLIQAGRMRGDVVCRLVEPSQKPSRVALEGDCRWLRSQKRSRRLPWTHVLLVSDSPETQGHDQHGSACIVMGIHQLLHLFCLSVEVC